MKFAEFPAVIFYLIDITKINLNTSIIHKYTSFDFQVEWFKKCALPKGLINRHISNWSLLVIQSFSVKLFLVDSIFQDIFIFQQLWLSLS